MTDKVYYAIGDVHGEDDKLGLMHDFIREDAQRLGVAPHFVHLGDLIDRGPDSRGVVGRVMRLHAEEGARVITIRGNHEEMMLDAVKAGPWMDEDWGWNGGQQALMSYERINGSHDDWRDAIDRDHVSWLRGLPTIYRDGSLVFVHAGIDPAAFPECREEIHLWTRSAKFFDERRWPDRPELEDLLVVHGHTPTEDFEPERGVRRINVDTGACFGGPLTAVVLAPNEKPRFLYAR